MGILFRFWIQGLGKHPEKRSLDALSGVVKGGFRGSGIPSNNGQENGNYYNST